MERKGEEFFLAYIYCLLSIGGLSHLEDGTLGDGQSKSAVKQRHAERRELTQTMILHDCNEIAAAAENDNVQGEEPVDDAQLAAVQME